MFDTGATLDALGLSGAIRGGFDGTWRGGGAPYRVTTPVDGSELGLVETVDRDGLDAILAASHRAFAAWRLVPAPKRAAVVRELRQEVGVNREDLARLVTLETGKPLREARGEVQEMLDVFDLAVGQGRQLYGLTMPSERGRHRLQERWHPLGVVGVITAFNFPVAVWAWNAALALVCGDPVLWKPSSKTPLTAVACTLIAERVLSRCGHDPALCSLVIGPGREVGDLVTTDRRVALVSYTGSVERGRRVGVLVQERFGRSLLELGGNNAVIVTEHADLELAIRVVYFGTVGTAGQRCTSTRRVIVHERIHDEFTERLRALFEETLPGDPRDEATLMGPLVDRGAVDAMQRSMGRLVEQGGTILTGGERLDRPGGCYVTPCLATATGDMPVVRDETFAPLLYVMPCRDLDQAIRLQNDVPQGLSSAIVTSDYEEAERFLDADGSDCGMANVNAGTSGAEIGGAFGGEKETGGGRESGSDAWKFYMRRQTSALNFSGRLELAQDLTPEI